MSTGAQVWVSSNLTENRHTVNLPEATLCYQKDLFLKEFPSEPKWSREEELSLPQHNTPWLLIMEKCHLLLWGPETLRTPSASCLLTAGEIECNRTQQVACGEKCIPVAWLCNGEQECPDGTDEQCGKHFSRCCRSPALASKSRMSIPEVKIWKALQPKVV